MLLLSALLLLPSVPVVSADRGMIPVIPDVSIYEPGQKAIIAWNGKEEILVLSTDVSSTDNTTVLEILPLPSNPWMIEKASLESFYVVQELIWYHMPPSPPRFGNETDEVKVIFHEKIGMHDITVVEAHNVSEFAEWMAEFLLENGIGQQVSLESFELVIEDYMSRGFRFYVLDLIELRTDQKSVEPILYKFNTTFLYYPLLITSPIGGDGKIQLFLLTEGIIESGYYPLTKAQYRGRNILEPIQFIVSNKELSSIDPRIGELFKDKAWMTALIYEGPLSVLREDIAITEITHVATGDLNIDGKVNIIDVAITAKAFGSYPGHTRWNPIADLNKDGIIDITDISIVAKQFGKTS